MRRSASRNPDGTARSAQTNRWPSWVHAGQQLGGAEPPSQCRVSARGYPWTGRAGSSPSRPAACPELDFRWGVGYIPERAGHDEPRLCQCQEFSMNHGILHLSRHGHGSWLLILFGLFSLMSVIGFVTPPPITPRALLA